MLFPTSFRRWGWTHRPRPRRKPSASRRGCVPRLEALEDRNLPSTLMLTDLVQVSSTTPFTDTSDLVGQRGTASLNSEVEPSLAVDPTNSQHFVAVWQQDRWSNGGARGTVAGVSTDGGNTWTRVVVPGLTLASGGTYQRSSDPWVSIATNGDVYVSTLEVTLAPAGFPLNSAILVSKAPHTADGSLHFGTPTVLQADTSPFPNNLFNDKPSVTADPTDPNRVYVIWDRGEFPGDNAGFDAFHAGAAIRQDILLATTTDGGQHWTTRTIRSPQSDEGETGNQIVVEPDANGTLVDVFALTRGSGKQPTQADQQFQAVIRSTDHGLTWSDPIIIAADEGMPVTDPDTGAPVRSGDDIHLPEIAVNRQNGNLYAVWADARFDSKYSTDGIAFSMFTNGSQTWSDPIKVNQTPTNIPDGDQQAFTPVVAVNSAGTVAVGCYDFRNNTTDPGLPTDFWLVHASGNFTSPGSWTADEKRLTDTSFNMENAAPTSRGLFLGDYEGLAAAGTSFYALFAQAGASTSDPSNTWFRDPPPAPPSPTAIEAPAPGGPATDALAGLDLGALTPSISSPGGIGLPRAGERAAVVDPLPSVTGHSGPLVMPAVQSADILRSGGGTDADGDELLDAVFSDGWDNPLAG